MMFAQPVAQLRQQRVVRGLGQIGRLHPLRHQPRQRAIDRILAQPVLEEVHHQAALAVVDVTLVLDPHERQFLERFALAACEVAVELKRCLSEFGCFPAQCCGFICRTLNGSDGDIAIHVGLQGMSQACDLRIQLLT